MDAKLLNSRPGPSKCDLPVEVADYLVVLGFAWDTEQESLLDNLMAGTLHILGFNRKNRTVATNFTMSLNMCHSQKHAETNVCILDGETGMVLCLVENKTKWNKANPEPQLIAEAIAAFEHNNFQRALHGRPCLGSMTIPAIAMRNSCPTFYLIPVSMHLSNAVSIGKRPSHQTRVLKCGALADYWGRGPIGMKYVRYRRLVFQCLLAFKERAEGPWDEMVKKR
jgi:hypothetical protein